MSIEEDRRVEFSKRVHSGDSNSAWPPPPPPPRARKEAAAAVRDDKESDKGEREKRCRHRRSITPPNVRERCKVFVDGGNEAAAQECRRRHRDAPPQRAACRTEQRAASHLKQCVETCVHPRVGERGGDRVQRRGVVRRTACAAGERGGEEEQRRGVAGREAGVGQRCAAWPADVQQSLQKLGREAVHARADQQRQEMREALRMRCGGAPLERSHEERSAAAPSDGPLGRDCHWQI